MKSAVLSLLATAVLSITAPPAHAMLCPGGPGEGQVQIGVARGPGFGGAPICAPDPAAQARGIVAAQDQAARDREEAAAASREQMSSNIAWLTQAVKQIEEGRKALAHIDPNLSIAGLQRDARKGWWNVPDPAQSRAKAGENCAVVFVSERGVIGLHGPGGEYRGALLTFWGPDVPRPKEMKLVSVSLAQNDEPTVQTVRAYSYTERGGQGALALGVPSVEALMGAMEDVQRFRLTLDGKPVVDAAWHSGNTARAALQNCVSARPR